MYAVQRQNGLQTSLISQHKNYVNQSMWVGCLLTGFFASLFAFMLIKLFFFGCAWRLWNVCTNESISRDKWSGNVKEYRNRIGIDNERRTKRRISWEMFSTEIMHHFQSRYVFTELLNSRFCLINTKNLIEHWVFAWSLWTQWRERKLPKSNTQNY